MLKEILRAELRVLKFSLIISILFGLVFFLFGNVFSSFYNNESVSVFVALSFIIKMLWGFFLIGTCIVFVKMIFAKLKEK
jgi:Na+-driven multidrug efflux pump